MIFSAGNILYRLHARIYVVVLILRWMVPGDICLEMRRKLNEVYLMMSLFLMVDATSSGA